MKTIIRRSEPENYRAAAGKELTRKLDTVAQDQTTGIVTLRLETHRGSVTKASIIVEEKIFSNE